MSDEPMFYIQDRRSYVGDCVIWWRPEGRGYTLNLREAGKFSVDKKAGLRDTDVMVPCEAAESASEEVNHVTADSLRRALEKFNEKEKAHG